MDLNDKILDRLNDSELKQYSDIRDNYLPEKKLSFNDYHSLIEVISKLKKEWKEINEYRESNKKPTSRIKKNFVTGGKGIKKGFTYPMKSEFNTLSKVIAFLENNILPILQLYKSDKLENKTKNNSKKDTSKKTDESITKSIIKNIDKFGNDFSQKNIAKHCNFSESTLSRRYKNIKFLQNLGTLIYKVTESNDNEYIFNFFTEITNKINKLKTAKNKYSKSSKEISFSDIDNFEDYH